MEQSSMCKGGNSAGACSGAYGLAVVGAAVYFIQHATSFWMGVLGVGKAIVWPAVLMYQVLEFLSM